MGSSLTKIQDLALYGDIMELKKELEQYAAKNESNNARMNQDLGDILLQVVQVYNRPLQKMQCTIEILIRSGADVTVMNPSNGWNCLHYACSTGNIAYVPFLLQHETPVIRDVRGLYPQDVIPKRPSSSQTNSNTDVVFKTFYDHVLRLLQAASMGTSRSVLEVHSPTQTHEWGNPITVKYQLDPSEEMEGSYVQMIYHEEHQKFDTEPIRGPYRPCSARAGLMRFPSTDLPVDAVCHFILISSDKSMMKRTIQSSTGALWLGKGVARYIFTVAGEVFRHPSAQLDHKTFKDPEEFRLFIAAHQKPAKTSSSKDSLTLHSSPKGEKEEEIQRPEIATTVNH